MFAVLLLACPANAVTKQDWMSCMDVKKEDISLAACDRVLQDKNITGAQREDVQTRRKLKQDKGEDLVILGSASIVSQLSAARLIDSYMIAVAPIVLGGGKTMFAGLSAPLSLKLTQSRPFKNGTVVLSYDLAS